MSIIFGNNHFITKRRGYQTFNVCNFKIGDKVKYRTFSIEGEITGKDNMTGLWIINNAMLASDEDLILNYSSYAPKDKPKIGCTCGSTSVGSDRHSSWCDSK